MDIAAKYCSIRSELEEDACYLTAKLFGLIERLYRLIGADHQDFLAARVACLKVRKELSESRNRLEDHRIAHGC